VVAGTAAAVLAWLAVTMGWTLVAGEMPGVLTGLVPALAAMAPMRAALLAFVAGAFLLVLAVYAVAAVVFGRAMARA